MVHSGIATWCVLYVFLERRKKYSTQLLVDSLVKEEPKPPHPATGRRNCSWGSQCHIIVDMRWNNGWILTIIVKTLRKNLKPCKNTLFTAQSTLITSIFILQPGRGLWFFSHYSLCMLENQGVVLCLWPLSHSLPSVPISLWGL